MYFDPDYTGTITGEKIGKSSNKWGSCIDLLRHTQTVVKGNDGIERLVTSGEQNVSGQIAELRIPLNPPSQLARSLRKNCWLFY